MILRRHSKEQRSEQVHDLRHKLRTKGHKGYYKDYGQPTNLTRVKEDFVILRKEELKSQITRLVQEGTKGTSKIRP